MQVLLTLLLLIAPASRAAAPFEVGEQLTYGGCYKFAVNFCASNALTLSVAAIDTIAGEPQWRFTMQFAVNKVLFHNKSALTSWTATRDFVSRRFVHIIDETGYHKQDDFRIHADSGFYRNIDMEAHAVPKLPLDDLAFFFFLRLPSTPLVVGQQYQIDRYFKDDRNPVRISVVRREPCTLPGRVSVQCLVLNPIVEDPPHGLFMAENHATIWMTDDARRLPVRIKAGPMTMELQQIGELPTH